MGELKICTLFILSNQPTTQPPTSLKVKNVHNFAIPPAFPSTGTYGQTQSLCGQEYVSPSSTVFVYKRYFKQGSFIFDLFFVV